jgi:hypothetical protein
MKAIYNTKTTPITDKVKLIVSFIFALLNTKYSQI